MFEGPALCFEQEEAMLAALEKDPASFKGKVVVIRYEGPKGGPGMPEMLTPTSAIMGEPRALVFGDGSCFWVAILPIPGGLRDAFFWVGGWVGGGGKKGIGSTASSRGRLARSPTHPSRAWRAAFSRLALDCSWLGQSIRAPPPPPPLTPAPPKPHHSQARGLARRWP